MRSSGGDGLRPQVASENEIIEEFEPEDEDIHEEGEEAEEPKGLRAPLKVSKEQRDAHEITHTPYRVPSLRSGQGPECATQDEDRGAVRETGAQSEHGLLLHEPGRREGGQEPIDRHGGREHRREVCQGRGAEKDWENEMEWLVKDMSEEMKSWGHQGGDGGHIILRSDGERSIGL